MRRTERCEFCGKHAEARAVVSSALGMLICVDCVAACARELSRRAAPMVVVMPRSCLRCGAALDGRPHLECQGRLVQALGASVRKLEAVFDCMLGRGFLRARRLALQSVCRLGAGDALGRAELCVAYGELRHASEMILEAVVALSVADAEDGYPYGEVLRGLECFFESRSGAPDKRVRALFAMG